MRKLLFCAVFALLSVPTMAQVTNGDFSTGDLSGWNVFTTLNGTANAGSTPNVTSFDVTGSGASLAAHLNVGQLVAGSNLAEGGGLFQNVFFGAAGTASFSADIAMRQRFKLDDLDAGLFEMMLDGNVIDSFDFGPIGEDTTIRTQLSASGFVSAGSHELRFRITRPFPAGFTPDQYIDNVLVLGPSSVVPESSSAALLIAGGLPFAGLLIRKRK